MTVSTRHFLVTEDEIRPLGQRVAGRLRRGEALLPDYAGRDLHVVEVTVEMKDRAVLKVREVSTTILSLDERGGMRSRLLEELRASLAKSRTGRVSARARWSPPKALLDRITDLALGRAKSKLKPPRATVVPATDRGAPRPARHARRRPVAAENHGE